jgi:formate dehydrogenase maturation protein FdhE
MQVKRKRIKNITHLKIDNFAFENVENSNYLGSILNADNKTNIEIAEKIATGNKAHYANSKLIISKLLKKNTRMKMCKTIRPVVTYPSEAWTLTAKDENNLRIFERQILKKMFGPVNIDNVWRI